MDGGEDVRGEVSLYLDGQRFVLRPSYQAVRTLEGKTKMSVVELFTSAADGSMVSDHLAMVVADFIRAWGASLIVDDATPPLDRAMVTTARGVSAERIGELIYETGTMEIMAKAAIALGMAANGGCLASGEPKPATGTMMMAETPDAGLPE